MSKKKPLSKRPTGRQPPREVLKYGITEAALNGETALFDVLPGIGKSRSIPKVADAMPVTVLTNLTDNYDQFEDWGKEDGVGVEKLPKREFCPTLRDENPSYRDDPVAQEARNARNNGWSPGEIHREFDLPCQRGENSCPYCERVTQIDADGLDLLVGNFVQAYNPAYVENRVVVLDEDAFDEYYTVIENPAKEAQEFIDTLDDFPFDSLRRLEGDDRVKALEELGKIGLEPTDHRDSVGDFHAKAPLIAYAIYGAKKLDNGLKYTELPGDRTAVFEKLYETSGDGHDDGTPTMWFFDLPDFSGAEAVIGLDATPCLSKWRRVLGGDFKHYRLFGEQERNRYLREKGYEFIQLNSHAWPAQGGNLSIPKCEAYLREVHQKHGKRPDLITGKDIRDQLEERGLDHLWDEDLYYDALRGKNQIGDSQLLVVLGAPSRGDSYYQHLTALFGESAERVEETQGMNLSLGNPIADDILNMHRRGGVFQAAMRAGRKDDTEATVYIATGLVPDWLETKKIGRETPSGSFDACPHGNLRNDSDRAVLSVLENEDGISGREIARRADLSKSTAMDSLNRLREEGIAEKTGAGRGTKWHANGVESLNIAGRVDLTRMAEHSLKNSLRESRPFSDRVIPRRDPFELPPERRYPDWMRDTMHRARERKFDEQMKQARRNSHE
ncbi:winged helix-turn-helix domain-containing protein [Halorussus salilacus]|uniref:winged helix-turn-helix domain-containing protein n=1 Tax=Halorussus salilacus TaxID=2953750 RepID=UPI00209CB478|nr:winged helix-turn-helix domain-containing protein [Halorussus salilacus]USZ69407.1 winged helix-turn-helix domain-containing protein [Halorussus salilacus]